MTRILHLEEWAGQWVGVNQRGEVVVSGSTVEELVSKATTEGIGDIELVQAPDPADAVSYGLA